LQKILAEIVRQITFGRVVVEHAAKLLTGPEKLSLSVQWPPWVRRGQVEQLERAVERTLETLRPTLRSRTNGTVDFTPDIGELFGQWKGVPSSRRQ
jgi:hypothetical protein